MSRPAICPDCGGWRDKRAIRCRECDYSHRKGKPAAPEDVMRRLLANTQKTDTCWLWLGFCEPKGYGKLKAWGEQLAHRLSYRLHVGPIPEGLTLDHLCCNKRCVNPDHLEPVTSGENTRRYHRMRSTAA